MKFRITVILLVLFSGLIFQNHAYADDSDQALNNTYKKIMSLLDKKAQQELRDTQRLWIKFRDAECTFESILLNVAATYCHETFAGKRVQSLQREYRSLLIDDTFRSLIDQLPTIPFYSSDYIRWPGGGTYSIGIQLQKIISIADIEGAFGDKMFLSGPHQSGFKHDSETDFGHYNPKFLNWFTQKIDVLLSDPEFIARTKKIVDEYLINEIDLYLTTYLYLAQNPKIKEQLTQEFISHYTQKTLPNMLNYSLFVNHNRIKNPDWDGTSDTAEYKWVYTRDITSQYQWMVVELDKQHYYTHNGTAVFFWIRRNTDQTTQQFYQLFKLFMKHYKPRQLEIILQRDYVAPQTLPVGTELLRMEF